MTHQPRHILLSTHDVAAREGVSAVQVATWCRQGQIFPAQSMLGRWLISRGYILVPRAMGRPVEKKINRKKKVERRGRPLGSKNKKPYPVGVKRPRKIKLN